VCLGPFGIGSDFPLLALLHKKTFRAAFQPKVRA
jgi:hypothetical protein